MKSLIQRLPGARSRTGGALAAAIAISLAGLIAQPAFADHDNDRGARDYRDGDRQDERGYHAGDRQDERGYEHHRYVHYHHPVYAPAPVYYPRQESPGINLFIPLWDR